MHRHRLQQSFISLHGGWPARSFVEMPLVWIWLRGCLRVSPLLRLIQVSAGLFPLSLDIVDVHGPSSGLFFGYHFVFPTKVVADVLHTRVSLGVGQHTCMCVYITCIDATNELLPKF